MGKNEKAEKIIIRIILVVIVMIVTLVSILIISNTSQDISKMSDDEIVKRFAKDENIIYEIIPSNDDKNIFPKYYLYKIDDTTKKIILKEISNTDEISNKVISEENAEKIKSLIQQCISKSEESESETGFEVIDKKTREEGFSEWTSTLMNYIYEMK